ncbi:hypothetical protein M758_1G270500 [Ceratodon purpureus]|nr:hypothetical protein M758_1G270500 [Ceratodon purpureus]
MSSSSPEALYELSIQQDLPPAPNVGPQCADWLPRFAGSSWLAYAASSAVVVATAASPLNPGESSSGRFFQQVLETRSSNVEENCEGRDLVTSVGWAPVGPSVGQLAAAVGKAIHLYSPTKLARDLTAGPISSEMPLAWETKQVLQHTFQVLTFSWTESGDGLLSAGSDITMWKRGESGFSVLWQVQPAVPQAYAASSWSSSGLVATGDGISETQANFVSKEECIADEKTTDSSMGKATVWCWQEGQEIQGIELQHPSEVSMIQWRPSNGYGEDPYTYRPVLLTSARDGSIRLWLDMEGPSYSSFCFGDNQELKKKPTFTMAAVVDVNTCLDGVLGHDIFVTWASESRTGGSFEEKRQTIRNKYANMRDLAPCEWLVGVGPRGKVALWSIHSLDDILPTRSPRVTLWQQGDDVFSEPSTLNTLPGGGATDRLMMKAVVQRPEGTLAVAPSSLDLFEALPSGHFRWSRLWPPVSAIGTGGGHVGSGAQTTRNKSAWGVSSEIVHLDGHRGAVLQVALHPSPTVALAASVDNQGVVLLWDLSAWASPQVKVMSSQTLGWKLAGQISGLQNSSRSSYHRIAWAPSSLPEGRAILLAGDIQKIDCFLVGRSDSQRKSDSSILTDHLHCLRCPVFSEGDRLHAISAIPLPLNASLQVAEERSFIIIGNDSGGGILASWAVQLQVTALSGSSQDDKVTAVGVQDGTELEVEGNHCTPDSKFQVLEKSGYVLYAGSLVSQERIYIKDTLIGSVMFDGGERVTSIAVVSGSIKGSLSTHLEVYEKAHPYDMLTGCADGSVRLYKVFSSLAYASHSAMSQTGSYFWQCIGVIRAHLSPVIIAATTATGEKIASVGEAEHNKTVKIWEVDSCNENGEFEFEGQVTLSQPIVALSWMNSGMGCVLLAVATKFDLSIYVQDRPSSQEVSRSTVWIRLASFSFNTAIDHLLWSFQGSPVLSSEGHIWVFSPWVCAKPKSSYGNGNIRSSVEGVRQLGACNSCRLLQAAEVLVSPLADYHPRALFWSLFKGDKSRARACIRHLSHYLAATTGRPAANHNEACVSDKIDQVHIQIPRMGLAKLLQKDVSVTTQASANLDSAYNTSFTFMNSPITQPPNVSDKYSFLNNTSWLDEFSDELSEVKPSRSAQSQDALKTGGSESFSKDEMEAIVQFIEDGRSVLKLSEEEFKQVLALVEVVGEMDGVKQAAQCAGLDLSGQRFWLAHRYNSLLASQSGGKKGGVQGIQVDSEALAWALQSDTKETLLDVCTSEQSLWPELRALGVGFWFTDAVPLRKKMEKVARLQFMASRDAKDSALLYIALERRTVLAGLFKISKDERDRPLVDFMARDFREEKHKAAALKNAYVLMGKHRHELAAAFFLLGGDIDSAVSVCTKNLEDPQLGLVVCRLVEGSDGPIGRKLISKFVLPGAVKTGDYWLASLCQWLLGNGIETMHEVISGCQPAVSAEGIQEKTTESRNTSCSIPLDPGVADYCTVLVLKPRLLREPQRDKVTAISKQATLRASLALRKIGLPLQALELMTDSSGVKTVTENGHHEVSPINTGFNLDIMEHSASQDIIRANLLLPELVADVHELAKQNLALECMSQLVQEYLNWAAALQSSSRKLSDIHEGTESSSITEVGSATIEEAEKKIEEGIEALKSTFSMDASAIVSGVVTWAINHHCLYVYYRLLLAQHAGFKYPEQKFSLSSGAGLSLKSDVLGSVWKEAPWALARMILACGSSLFSLANSTSKSPTWKSMMPREQIEELVRYGGELQKLASLLSGHSGSTVNVALVGNEDMKKKTQRAMILLAFVYYVSAAWLGKNGKALVALVAPTISDPTKSPEMPNTNSSVTWFQDLCSESEEEQNSLTKLAVSGDTDAVLLPEEEVWRVTGVALWVHMVAYVKKQLAGTGKDTGYSGFGRVSVPQAPSKSSVNLPPTSTGSPAQAPSTSSSRLVATFMGLGIQSTSSVPSTAWSEIKNKMRDDTQALMNTSSASSDQDVVRVAESPRSSRNYGDLYLSLLSSLGCIASGLQQQLAAHLHHLLEVKGNSDPLVIWLWGKHSDLRIESSSSPKAGISANKPASAADGKQLFPVVYPEIQLGGHDKSSKELWRLLVVRESVRSTLAMEGVIGPTSKAISLKQGDWREARRRSVLSATDLDGHASTTSATKTSRIADKTLTVGFTGESDGSEGLYVPEFQKPEAMFSLSGELIEAFCINSCNPDQVVLATNRKGLMYLDLHTRGPFTETSESMLEQGDWPRSSWAGAVSTPGSSLKSQRSSSLSLGGPAAGAPQKSGKEAMKSGGVAFGMPGYGGMGAWGGWEDWEDNDSVVDPIATVDNVRTKALAAHPSQPIFLVGSNNTHVYLWEYGKPSATATYGVLPAANMPPPYVIPSVATVRFDSGGHRFVTAAMDGTVSTWQLEVGGRSNVRPTESCLFFGTHASDATFIVGSSSLVAATGMTNTGNNLIAWDTLAPPSSNRQSISCHEGGARCIASLDVGIGGSSSSPWIVSGGKGGDIAVHDFRYILAKKAKRPQSPSSSSSKNGVDEAGKNGMLWHVPKAHAGSVTKATAVPGTSYFFTGSKDGDVKLWDVSTRSMVGHWQKVHERHTFLQVTTRSLGSIIQQAAVTDVQPTVDGFLSCGGDGTVKLFRHQ